MLKNADITSFFKPIPKDSQNSQVSKSQVPLPSQSRTPASPSPAPPSFPPPLLSSSPPVPASSVRDRSAVIRGSDDEDDDDFISSDDDLPSLFSKPNGGSTVIPVPPARKDPLWATPRAKRTALEFHSSPLTIMPKHKFDIKALMQHAKADSAVEESEQRIESLLACGSAAKEAAAADAAAAASAGSGREKPISLHDTMLDVFSDPEGSQEEGTRHKLLQAVKRTEMTVQRKQWRFSDHLDHHADGAVSSIEARRPFPGNAATGTWQFLAQAQGRSELFEDGLPYNVQVRMQNLPDDIFLWVLREIPAEKSRKLREEYLRLLGVCPDQAGRLLDTNRIDQLFSDAGASKRVFQSPSKATNGGGSEQRDMYLRRDWTPIRSVLGILIETSQGLSVPSLTRSVAILLRLGMDDLVREDRNVARDYQDALNQLIHAVPRASWDNFVCALSAIINLAALTNHPQP